jgi:hypothetical protein
MQIKKSIFVFLTIAVFFLLPVHPLHAVFPAQETGADDDGLHNKVMCGYQGWFGAPGDNLVNTGTWFHWCLLETEPRPDTITFDAWPDYSEYREDQLFYPVNFDWFYPNGKKAGFFSSNIRETVFLHCKWMRDYGIDGIFLQRFTNMLKSENIKLRNDIVLDLILEGVREYGLKVVIMYDVKGTRITKISPWLIEDWMDLVDEKQVIQHPCYLYHRDREGRRLPLVAVWGLGFIGIGSREEAWRVIDFLKRSDNPAYHTTLMGGVPGYWRFGIRDSKDIYIDVFAAYDILSPWTVGRFKSEKQAEQWLIEIMNGDIKLARSRGQEYLPVSFPGFSNSNLERNRQSAAGFSRPYPSKNRVFPEDLPAGKLNSIPRNGGHFMWTQFYLWRRAGTDMLYIAMFDEVDEGTAIFKIAPNADFVPRPNLFLSLDTDGYALRSDHFLWMTGSAGFIIKHNLPFPSQQPARFLEDSFTVERIKERAWLTVKHVGKIDITVNDPAVSRLVLYKMEGDQELREFKVIHGEEFQNRTYSTKDEPLEKDKTYTYLLVGFDANGIPVGFSNRERI